MPLIAAQAMSKYPKICHAANLDLLSLLRAFATLPVLQKAAH
jgi:ribonuclease D